MPAPSHRITFDGSRGEPLAARLDLPAGPPLAFALFAHCFTCSKDIKAAGRIAAGLNAAGIAVLRFDFTGLGASGGEFANTDFSSNLEDLRRAAGWLRDNHHAPQLLVGHSLGGAAVVAVASDLPEVRAVATIGAPSSTLHLRHLFADSTATLEREGLAQVTIAGRAFTIRRELLDDLDTHDVERKAAELHRALLVLHAPTDLEVGIEHAGRLFAAARHPKSFVALDGADHLLTRAEDATFAAHMIGAWATRYLEAEGPPAAPAPAPTAPVVVAETTQGTYLNHVVAGRHRFLVDEPGDIGGYDAGPSPYDLVAAALGACTSMTLRLHADRKALPLERVTVEIEHDRVYAEDRNSTTTSAGQGIDRFVRRIRLDGPLDESQRTDLLRVADRCPVHRTLTRASEIATELLP
jgi:putative redox protein